ncbi:MAG TPA: biopolymer transporter ExbD [Candidatus Polarisedimenticolaceae bacterium]|nr:biopolymer transporter ExbD [Candidatus Polarisedimenticolaceae bacterium]
MQSVKVESVNSAINVTPLVDVMLVMLIIFMVVTPMLTKGPPVQVPKASNPPTKPEEKTQILISVSKDKQIFVDKEPLASPQAFADRLTEEYQRNKNASIVIKGDARLEYGEVKKAMLKVKETGFEQVGLITLKQE